MKHKHSGERLLSTGRWYVISPEGRKMMLRVEKRNHRKKSKKKKES